MSNDTEIKLRKIISENSETLSSVNEIGLDDDLSDLGIDSMSFIKIMVAIESELDFEFQDDVLDINKMSSLRKIVEYIESIKQGE